VVNKLPDLDHAGKFQKSYENVESLVNSNFFKEGVVTEHENHQGRRAGALGYKVGMTGVYDMWGIYHPLTIIHVDRCQVTQIKTKEKEGVNSLQIGVGEKKVQKMKKPLMGHFMKAGTPYKQYVRDFKVDPENFLPPGFMISVRHFTVGQLVDVRAVTTDKGFQGAMKKWGFHGMRATHGVSVAHRHLGSTGASTNPGRVFKGKKMHGKMGGHTIKIHNLPVYKIDYPRSLIYLRGPVPGKEGNLIELSDSFFKPEANEGILNYPTFVPKEGICYANIVQMEADEQDPNEVWLHDEALPKFRDDDEGDDTAPAVAGMD